MGGEALERIALTLFDAVLNDPELSSLRRLLTVEQYRDSAIGQRLREYWIAAPLAFQSELFADLFRTGEFRDGLDPYATALASFAPILVLLHLGEQGGDDEARARLSLTKHIGHFRGTHLKDPS